MAPCTPRRTSTDASDRSPAEAQERGEVEERREGRRTSEFLVGGGRAPSKCVGSDAFICYPPSPPPPSAPPPSPSPPHPEGCAKIRSSVVPNGCPEYATTWYAWTRKLDDGDDGIFEWRVSDVLTVSAEQEAQQGLSPAAEAIREDAILDGNLQEVEPIVDGNIREEVILDGNNNGGAVSPINDGSTILDGNIKEEAILDGNIREEVILGGNIREEVILDGNNAAVVRDPIKFRRSRRELLPDYYGRADPRPSRARTRRRGARSSPRVPHRRRARRHRRRRHRRRRHRRIRRRRRPALSLSHRATRASTSACTRRRRLPASGTRRTLPTCGRSCLQRISRAGRPSIGTYGNSLTPASGHTARPPRSTKMTTTPEVTTTTTTTWRPSGPSPWRPWHYYDQAEDDDGRRLEEETTGTLDFKEPLTVEEWLRRRIAAGHRPGKWLRPNACSRSRTIGQARTSLPFSGLHTGSAGPPQRTGRSRWGKILRSISPLK